MFLKNIFYKTVFYFLDAKLSAATYRQFSSEFLARWQ